MKIVDLIETPDLLKKVPNIADLMDLNKIFKKENSELRIVGGAVRDLLQDKSPKDVDLCTPSTPEVMIAIGKKYNIKTILTGLSHGTITFLINGEHYEITTLRIDKNTDGRHADVEFTTDWETDMSRRDLTINALSLDFDGNVHDFHGGRDDITNGNIKFVGQAEDRIKEDYLRILRFFRFYGKISNPVWDYRTLDIIRNNAPGLKDVSGERVWMELSKILTGNHVKDIIDAMLATEVMDYALFGNIVLDTSDVNRLSRFKDPMLSLASMIYPVYVNSLNNRLKFSLEEKKLLTFLSNNKKTAFSIKDYKTQLVNNTPREYVLKLLLLKDDRASLQVINSWEIPVFPITGDDLIAQGYKEGPELGKRLVFLKKQWIDNDFKLP